MDLLLNVDLVNCNDKVHLCLRLSAHIMRRALAPLFAPLAHYITKPYDMLFYICLLGHRSTLSGLTELKRRQEQLLRRPLQAHLNHYHTFTIPLDPLI